MDLRKLLKCPVTVALLILWAALSVVGYLGKDTIYKNYTVDIRTTPYFVLVFDGLHDGIFPWSHVGAPGGIGENGKLPSILLPGESVSDTELAGGTETVGETETEEAPHTREFCMVDDDWFDDAVFIGDSRTVGLRDYGGLDNATFYASTGLGIYDMWTEKFCEVDGEKTTLEDALSRRQFGKIYFQIGINEMGRGTPTVLWSSTRSRFRNLENSSPMRSSMCRVSCGLQRPSPTRIKFLTIRESMNAI